MLPALLVSNWIYNDYIDILFISQNMNVNMIHTCSSSRNITKKMITINYKINIHISIENTYSANTIENTYSAKTIENTYANAITVHGWVSIEK